MLTSDSQDRGGNCTHLIWWRTGLLVSSGVSGATCLLAIWKRGIASQAALRSVSRYRGASRIRFGSSCCNSTVHVIECWTRIAPVEFATPIFSSQARPLRFGRLKGFSIWNRFRCEFGLRRVSFRSRRFKIARSEAIRLGGSRKGGF